MRRFSLTGISFLSVLAVAGLAHAAIGPATAAAPVTKVEALALPPAPGVSAAAPAVQSLPLFAELDKQMADGRRLAMTRQKKLLKAMESETAAAPVAAVTPAPDLLAGIPGLLPEAVPPVREKLASISAAQFDETGEISTARTLEERRKIDRHRRLMAQKTRAAWQQTQQAAQVPVAEKPAIALKAPQVKKPADSKPVVAAVKRAPTPEKPAVKLADKKPAVVKVVKAPVAPQPETLSAIEPAAGAPAPAPQAAAPAPSSFLDQIMSYHHTGKSSAAAPAGGQMTLQALLAGIGAPADTLSPVEGTDNALKWSVGSISGMYEQVDAGKDFVAQADAYLARYRKDCGKQVNVRLSKPEAIASGQMIVADATCKAKGNNYVATFLFLNDGRDMKTLIHSAYPADQAAAFDLRNKMVARLKDAPGLAAIKPVTTTVIQ